MGVKLVVANGRGVVGVGEGELKLVVAKGRGELEVAKGS